MLLNSLLQSWMSANCFPSFVCTENASTRETATDVHARLVTSLAREV